jgi:hypothetical protein
MADYACANPPYELARLARAAILQRGRRVLNRDLLHVPTMPSARLKNAWLQL